MAILSGVPGLDIAVQTFEDGTPNDLSEYEDDGEWTYREFAHIPEAQRSCKYIESTAGTAFRIRILLRHPFRITSQSVTFKASVDGHGIAQATCSAAALYSNSGLYMEIMSSRLDRVNANQIISRQLQFSEIQKGQLCGDAPRYRVLLKLSQLMMPIPHESKRMQKQLLVLER